jgi:hypothetical protein
VVAKYQPKVGTLVSSTFAVEDAKGMAGDSGEVTCTIVAPDGTESILTLSGGGVVRDGIGLYHVDFPISLPGVWVANWAASGGGPNVVECKNLVAQSACA